MVRDYCDPQVFVASAAGDAILARRYAATIRFLSFLYFGESRPGLGAFTMRDLGLIRARRPDSDYEPRFADIDEAQSAYFFAAALADLARGADVAAPATWPGTAPHERPEPAGAESITFRYGCRRPRGSVRGGGWRANAVERVLVVQISSAARALSTSSGRTYIT